MAPSAEDMWYCGRRWFEAEPLSVGVLGDLRIVEGCSKLDEVHSDGFELQDL